MKSTEMEFWDVQYREGRMPWDLQGVPQALEAYLQTATPGRVLIPGCGSGYEARAFYERGWDVLLMDYSPAAVKRAREILGALAPKVLLANFFTHDFGGRRFDAIYERAFLCALPQAIRPDYACRVAELLAGNGRLIGLFLYGREVEPPPHPLTEEQAQKLFGGKFMRGADQRATDSPPLFAGRERWQVWEAK